MSKSVIPENPMYNICSEVNDALNKFINREYIYVYAPYNKTKLFTLEDKIDYLHNSTHWFHFKSGPLRMVSFQNTTH